MIDRWSEDLTTEEREKLINEIAEGIVKRGLTTPAILFLEMNRPLSFVASQSLVVGSPFLAPFVGIDRVQDFSRLLKDRENVELLIRRIEDVSEERNHIAPKTPPEP